MTARMICSEHGIDCTGLHPKSWPEPLIPYDVMQQVLGAALNESVTAQFLKQTGQWPPPSSWYARFWRRVDSYLPRVSVHIGPRPDCYCDD